MGTPRAAFYTEERMHGGQVGTGYGLANEAALENRSIVSHYYGTNDMTNSYDLEYWSYIYGKALDDGEHGFLVYLNFDGEGSDCARVTSGTFDSRLTSGFRVSQHSHLPRISQDRRRGKRMVGNGHAGAVYRGIPAYSRSCQKIRSQRGSCFLAQLQQLIPA